MEQADLLGEAQGGGVDDVVAAAAGQVLQLCLVGNGADRAGRARDVEPAREGRGWRHGAEDLREVPQGLRLAPVMLGDRPDPQHLLHPHDLVVEAGDVLEGKAQRLGGILHRRQEHQAGPGEQQGEAPDAHGPDVQQLRQHLHEHVSVVAVHVLEDVERGQRALRAGMHLAAQDLLADLGDDGPVHRAVLEVEGVGQRLVRMQDQVVPVHHVRAAQPDHVLLGTVDVRAQQLLGEPGQQPRVAGPVVEQARRPLRGVGASGDHQLDLVRHLREAVQPQRPRTYAHSVHAHSNARISYPNSAGAKPSRWLCACAARDFAT